MSVPKEIRHTVGNLGNMLRSAVERDGACLTLGEASRAKFGGFSSEALGRFRASILHRFGRRGDDLIRPTENIVELGRRLQTVDQEETPILRRVLRQGTPGAGRLIMLPGLHGTTWSFERLSKLIPSGPTIVGWDYPGLDPNGPKAMTVPEIANLISNAENVAGAADESVTLFGFCLGGSIAHAMVEGIEGSVKRLIVFDGHPYISASAISRMRWSISISIARQTASRGGWLESRLVRTGIQHLRMLTRHRPEPTDVETVLIRSGSRLSLGPLGMDQWSPYVGGLRMQLFGDLGHVDVFRHHCEEKIIPYLTAA